MKNKEYYISKGFDEKSAEYFANGRKKIIDVKPQNDFTLLLYFDNGEERIFDVKPLLKNGTVFETLQKYENFNRVYVDDCNCVAWDINPNIDSNVYWNNKIDLSSDNCYINSIPANRGNIDV